MAYASIVHGFKITADMVDNTEETSYNITDNVMAVSVRKRYLENSFPLFVINLNITQEMRDKMRDHEFFIHLRISYFNAEDTNSGSGDDSSDVTELGVVFDGDIRIYNSPYTTTYSKADEESEDNGGDSAKNSNPLISYTVSGIPEDLISINEEVINTVYKNCDLATCLVNMITSVNKFLPCKIQQPDNVSNYNNVLIPPVSLVQAISFLNNTYTIYGDETEALFLDSDALYLYSPLSESMPEDNILEFNVKSEDSTANSGKDGIVEMDSNNNNLKISSRYVPSISYEPKVISHASGSDAIFYSYDTSFNLTKSTKENENSYKKTRYFWNDKLYKQFENINMYKTDISLAISLSNINPQLITPYTKIRLIAQNYKNIEGDYSPTEVSYVFTTGNKKYYSNTLVISAVKRIKK